VAKADSLKPRFIVSLTSIEDNENNSNNKLIECMEKSHKKLVMKTLFLKSKPINESNNNKSESNDFDKTCLKIDSQINDSILIIIEFII
jgi:hypothetical protein